MFGVPGLDYPDLSPPDPNVFEPPHPAPEGYEWETYEDGTDYPNFRLVRVPDPAL
jgi:hypothetical protein